MNITIRNQRKTRHYLILPTALLIILINPEFAFASENEPPLQGLSLAGIPIEFFFFAFTLFGVALFHRRNLEIAAGGLLVILATNWRY